MTAKTILNDVLHDERGATAVEYGLICALIVIAMLTALGSVASESNAMWGHVSKTTTDAIKKSDT